ncbi:MAG: hypothetical protein H6710_15120 [Myxococcales bacterium]|nr:hypothetical protein [Myxococcales bacterium]MCB9701993.1 hypothetical protein [Myxococcales bacterium]
MKRPTALSVALALAAAAATPACDPGDPGEPELRVLADNSAALNGIILNGIILNGIILNGILLNGILLNGGDVEGVTLSASKAPDGAKVKKIWIDKASGALTIKSKAGGYFHGDEVAGTELTYSSEGGTYRLRLDAVMPVDDEEVKGGPLLGYAISYQVKAGELWTDPSPLCFDGQEEETDALLLPGAWDHQSGAALTHDSKTITIACRHAALAKCAEWGYRPGLMPNTHQTCLRMTRADYAGDGVPHTANGTPIHVADIYGVNTEEEAPGLVKEAEWGPHGALCLRRAAFRHPELTGCDDPEDKATCFPGIPECWGPPSSLKVFLKWWGARIVSAVELDLE